MELTRQQVEAAADMLGISIADLPAGQDTFYLSSHAEMAGYLEAIQTAEYRMGIYKQQYEVFINASVAIEKHLNFSEQPIKSAMKLQKIISHPEKFPELAPFIALFIPQKTEQSND